MRVIFSIFTCLALAFGGAGEGDAAPERTAYERALIAVGGEPERVEVIWDAQSYDADCVTAELRVEDWPAFLDALRDSGDPELEALADGASALGGTFPGPEEEPVTLSSISFAEGELRYAEQKIQWSAEGGAAQLQWVETENPGHWSVIWRLRDGDETAQHVDLTSFGDSGWVHIQLGDLWLDADWSRAAEGAWAVNGMLKLGKQRRDFSLTAPEAVAAICEGGPPLRFDSDETPSMDELRFALSGLSASENTF